MIFHSLAVHPMLGQWHTVQTKRAMDHRRTGSVVKFFLIFLSDLNPISVYSVYPRQQLTN